MYIRFRLPPGSGQFHAGYALNIIKQAVEDWASRHDIKYTQKTIKLEHRVAFDHDETYTLFAMTWNPEHKGRFPSWLEYEMVNVAGEKY